VDGITQQQGEKKNFFFEKARFEHGLCAENKNCF
jgi:hypothetical protein